MPSILTEIIRATASEAALRKYSPDQPRDDYGRWTSGDGGDYPTSSVTSLAEAQRLVAQAQGQPIGKNSQCASLTHALAPELPPASAWKPGEQVQGNANIPVGTPIATFNFQGQGGTNGYGPAFQPGGVSGQSHTGIYLGQDSGGLTILNQYSGSSGPRIDTIPWGSWGRSGQEGGLRYYVIAYD